MKYNNIFESITPLFQQNLFSIVVRMFFRIKPASKKTNPLLQKMIWIHLSSTWNILSQEAQLLACSNHSISPKSPLVHQQLSAHICRLHSSWWQDLINSPSLRTQPLDLFWPLECFSWHSCQKACWHAAIFALKHTNTQ